MNNKKRLMIIFFGILLVSFSIRVNAQYIDIRQGSEQLINFITDWAEPLLQGVLGGDSYGGLLFEKFLIFIIVLSMVYLGLKKVKIFEENPKILTVLSIIVPIIAVRYLDIRWVNAIIFQYEVLGIALSGVLPFIIFFFFIQNVSDNSTFRKIAWVFFIVIYFGLWATETRPSYSQIYFWTMVAAFLFLLLDGTIHKLKMKAQWDGAMKSSIHEEIAKIDNRIGVLKDSKLPLHIINSETNQLLKERKRLLSHLNKF